MRIAIFGTGYIGLTTGTCFAELGNHVMCVDTDFEKIRNLKFGRVPIYEPGLEELVLRNSRENRLYFTTEAKNAVGNYDVLVIAVGTPSAADGSVDLQYVFDVARTIGKLMNKYRLVVIKSTVPVGTAKKVEEIIRHESRGKCDFSVVSNPEFLREGAALVDFMTPDRIVVGYSDEKAKDIMYELYKPLERTNKPIMFTSVESSELIKYASNAMLATRISFMNELSHLCEAAGGDIKQVAKGVGLDDRIGPRFLQAGLGYGGACFPKDVKGLSHTLKSYNCTSHIIDAVEKVNQAQALSILPKVYKLLGKNLEGKKIAIMGLSFKPKTDDVRQAVSLKIMDALREKKAHIQAFDPVATHNAQNVLNDELTEYLDNPYDAIEGADIAIFVTEWNEFRMIDMEEVAQLMKQKNIIDGRNIFEREKLEKLGFHYISIGREIWN